MRYNFDRGFLDRTKTAIVNVVIAVNRDDEK